MAPSSRKTPSSPSLDTDDPTAPAIVRTTARMPELGPLDTFMKDPAVTEIMVNDVRNVMVEKAGKLSFSGFTYSSAEELNRVTQSILDFTGRSLTPDHPYVDVVLPDGSRVNIIGPPLTLGGPCLTIRKFPTRRLSLEDLLAAQTVDKKIAHFLSTCVAGHLNILISGGTGSGKTTLLNALSAYIPNSERIITIEDTPELILGQTNTVKLQTKPQTPVLPPITARELLANALRMRPDRLIVGEVRRSEAFDMLQAMNTGHAGSMTTIHANSPRDALSRLETLCLLAGSDLPLIAIRRQIANALDLVVQVKRLRNGRRHVVAIAEVTGMEGEIITLQDLFSFSIPPKVTPGQASAGVFKCAGLVPRFVERLREEGFEFPPNYFS